MDNIDYRLMSYYRLVLELAVERYAYERLLAQTRLLTDFA